MITFGADKVTLFLSKLYPAKKICSPLHHCFPSPFLPLHWACPQFAKAGAICCPKLDGVLCLHQAVQNKFSPSSSTFTTANK